VVEDPSRLCTDATLQVPFWNNSNRGSHAKHCGDLPLNVFPDGSTGCIVSHFRLRDHFQSRQRMISIKMNLKL
jgi:hypothetical protein